MRLRSIRIDSWWWCGGDVSQMVGKLTPVGGEEGNLAEMGESSSYSSEVLVKPVELK